MDLASALLELSTRKLLVFLVLLASVAAGILVAYELRLSPSLALQSRAFQVGVGDTSVLVDSKGSAIETLTPPTQTDPYSSFALLRRAQALSRLMDQNEIKRGMARRVGVPASRITVQLPIDPATSGVARPEPGSGARASQIVAASETYQLTIQDSSQAPVIRFFAQAPTAEEAIDLADAAARSLASYVADLERRSSRRRDDIRERVNEARIDLRRARGFRNKLEVRERIAEIQDDLGAGGLLGAVGVQVRRSSRPAGGIVSQGTNVQLAVAAGLATFVAGLLLILVGVGATRGIRGLREQRRTLERSWDPDLPADEERDGPPPPVGARATLRD